MPPKACSQSPFQGKKQRRDDDNDDNREKKVRILDCPIMSASVEQEITLKNHQLAVFPPCIDAADGKETQQTQEYAMCSEYLGPLFP